MKNINGVINKKINACELSEYIGKTVKIYGSIYKIRKMKGFAFVLLRTKDEILQCIYSEDWSDFLLEELKEECTVNVTAKVIAEERSRKGFELRMLEAEVLSEPAEERRSFSGG